MPTLPEDSESTMRMSEQQGGPPAVVDDGVTVTVRVVPRERWDDLVALVNEQQARGREMERAAILRLLDTLDSDDTEAMISTALGDELPAAGLSQVARAVLQVLRTLIKNGEHLP